MYRGKQGTEVFNLIEKMTVDDIVFIDNNDVYYKGDYGYILEICGRRDIAQWRRGQFNGSTPEDIYVYACSDDTRYMSNAVIEDYQDLNDAKRHLLNLLKYKLRNAEKHFLFLQERIARSRLKQPIAG